MIQSCLLRAAIKPFLEINRRLLCNFSQFDCDSCSRKIEFPECKACHKMVNYFKIFNM